MLMGRASCPRCNSQAYLRGLQRINTEIIVVNLVCEKCHKIQLAGFTSVSALAHQEVVDKLLALRRSTTDLETIRRLDYKLELLKKNKRLNDLLL